MASKVHVGWSLGGTRKQNRLEQQHLNIPNWTKKKAQQIFSETIEMATHAMRYVRALWSKSNHLFVTKTISFFIIWFCAFYSEVHPTEFDSAPFPENIDAIADLQPNPTHACSDLIQWVFLFPGVNALHCSLCLSPTELSSSVSTAFGHFHNVCTALNEYYLLQAYTIFHPTKCTYCFLLVTSMWVEKVTWRHIILLCCWIVLLAALKYLFILLHLYIVFQLPRNVRLHS